VKPGKLLNVCRSFRSQGDRCLRFARSIGRIDSSMKMRFPLWRYLFETSGCLGSRATVSPQATARFFAPFAALSFPRLTWAEQIMKFESISGNRRSRRQNLPQAAPAIIESLEMRALLAGPQVLTPTGTIADSTPVISWEAVDGAVSYDLWVSDVESREVIFIVSGLGTTNYTSATELHLGRTRIWVQANFADGSTSGWGPLRDVILQTAPTINGPTNVLLPATPFELNDTQPTITWSSPPGARSFEIFVSNQTQRTSTTYRVTNLTPLLDGDGNTIPDGNGDVVREEIRDFELPEELLMGQYRVFIRTTDDAGRVSGWSTAYNFEVVPAVVILRPSGPSFQNPALLEWMAVPGATHYEVWVSKVGSVNEQTAIYNPKYVTATSWQIPRTLATGDYVFWVRAKRLHQVTEINLRGTPTSGSYRIMLTTFGTNAQTVQTGVISFNATAAQIKAAVTALAGFENADVVTGGIAPNFTHLLQLPQTLGQVNVSVVGGVSPGRLTAVTRTSPEVVGLWSARKDFGTIQRPVITAPVGVSTNDPEVRTVTDARPTLEWTAIDKAARYEIWVDRTASSTIYLLADSTTNSYTFTTNIEAGNYFVWVRAFSTTGVVTAWSQPYRFTATGGAPVITSPVNGSTASTLPTITWAGVAEADHYEIHIAWVNVDFDYIQATGITSTEFTATDPLNSGTYRVWVRAIKVDGTALAWSRPVNFFVTDAAQSPVAPTVSLDLVVLTSLLATSAATNQAESASASAEPVAVGNRDTVVSDEQESGADSEPILRSTASEVQPAENPAWPAVAEAELIEKLAQACTTEEWWTTI